MAKKVKEEIRSFNEFPDLVEVEFDKIVQEYRAAHEQELAAKATKARLGPDIEAYLAVVGQKTLKVGDLIPVQCNGSSASTLDKHLLIQAGVSVDTIVACTIPGKSYTYVQVRKEGEE